MGKVSDLSPKKIAKIFGSLEANRLSRYEITSTVGVSRSSAKNIKKKMEYGDSLQDKHEGNCGRERITPRADRKIRGVYLENRKMSKRVLTEHIKDRCIQVS
ncbi:hypothetical protein CDAR_371901 [Caerostris darwini]|uniref:Uncharacterized protein n=1 Tax=Caerostris darwini TaxID=1538125 RepID=A0AAV4MA00_9ARAC|nr:hypothetical protein CDAR_371901 [Caerostris darwini]